MESRESRGNLHPVRSLRNRRPTVYPFYKVKAHVRVKLVKRAQSWTDYYYYYYYRLLLPKKLVYVQQILEKLPPRGLL